MNQIEQSKPLRAFHQAKWDEPIIFELDSPGQMGVELPPPDPQMALQVGDPLALIPRSALRQRPPTLPHVGQARVLRHYLRLSQECLGADLNVEIGQGTCTMKFNPPINERIARTPKLTELHPLQPADTMQGLLGILYQTKAMLAEISGMDAVCLQPQSGSQALMTLSAIMRAKHAADGQPQRNEIITTTFSHPSAAASAIVMGFKVRTVRARADGYPDYEHFRSLVGPNTAGFICANPEDTGLYNPKIARFTALVHENGGLCGYDQANANGLFGVARAREAGFDMCFFNLHKSFATPHGCGGPGTGAVAVVSELARFLPGPLVDFDGTRYVLTAATPDSVGKVRMFLGVPQVAVKAYAWMRSLGAAGLYAVAKTAALNNAYLYRRLVSAPGISAPFDPSAQRVEQARYSLSDLRAETGVETEDVQRRMCDFGLHYWTSHHPFVVPEPMTLEPTESPSKEDLDEYIDTLLYVLQEAEKDPEKVQSAPHCSTVHRNKEAMLDDPAQWAITWRMYLKKHPGQEMCP